MCKIFKCCSCGKQQHRGSRIHLTMPSKNLSYSDPQMSLRSRPLQSGAPRRQHRISLPLASTHYWEISSPCVSHVLLTHSAFGYCLMDIYQYKTLQDTTLPDLPMGQQRRGGKEEWRKVDQTAIRTTVSQKCPSLIQSHSGYLLLEALPSQRAPSCFPWAFLS